MTSEMDPKSWTKNFWGPFHLPIVYLKTTAKVTIYRNMKVSHTTCNVFFFIGAS